MDIKSHHYSEIAPNLYEIPASFRDDMRVPARFYSNPDLLREIEGDRSLVQLVNTATLPGIVGYALAMPDIHQGYGFPIGGVVATAAPDGVISPGGVGYDINCGVRLLASRLSRSEIAGHIPELISHLYRNCPSGVGKGGQVRLAPGELDKLLADGSRWALSRGFARHADLEHTEESGSMAGADPGHVSQRAHQRGMNQVGTLGGGNHFIEIDVVDQVLDQVAADTMGLFEGQVVVQIHCGSRGLGHQVCSDYVRSFQKDTLRFGITLPDRELVCAPLGSDEGQAYLSAMNAAANYAFANRQVLANAVRDSFSEALAGKVADTDLHQVYDVAHNMAKIEEHVVEGLPMELCVHRKGATRAFGPGSDDIPAAYRDIGQPVLVPGSMGTASWVLVGTAGSMEQSFGSCCHGAGRRMSRTRARKTIHGRELQSQLRRRGIHVHAGSISGLAEEAPAAYKDVDSVVDVVHEAGIARKVARLTPVAVIKG